MRFRRQAQAAGRLGHPGIVAVYEYGEDSPAGTTFIAMEPVRGWDLKSLFDAGARFTLEQTGRLTEAFMSNRYTNRRRDWSWFSSALFPSERHRWTGP